MSGRDGLGMGEGDNEMKKSGWVGLDLDLFMTEQEPNGGARGVLGWSEN